MGSVNKRLSSFFGSLLFGLIPLAADIENRNELFFSLIRLKQKGKSMFLLKKEISVEKSPYLLILKSSIPYLLGESKTLFIDANNSFEFQKKNSICEV